MNAVEVLTFKLIADIKELNADVSRAGAKLKELAAQANVPIKMFSQETIALAKEMLATAKALGQEDVEHEKALLNTLKYAEKHALALERSEIAQRKLVASGEQKQAVNQVKANEQYIKDLATQQALQRKAAEQRAYAFGKQMEEVDGIVAKTKAEEAARAAVTKRIQEGKASLSEYAANIDKILSKTTQQKLSGISPIFSKEGMAANVQTVQSALQQIMTATNTNVGNARRILSGMFPNIPTQNLDSAVKAINGVEPATKKAGKGLFSLTNALRTAIGTFEAMGIFLVTKFVGDTIKKAIDSIKQLELSLYNLAVAEASLSKQGIDINPEDFQDMIKAVQDLNLGISNIDASKSVANLATGLRDLGLSKEQLENLSKAAAIIAMSKGLSMENVVAQFVNGLAKGGKGLADLDIQVDASVIKQKALEEGLVKSEEAWNSLTAEQKQAIETQALYLITLDSANERLEQMGILNTSVTSTSRSVSSAWEELTTTMGEIFKFPIVAFNTALTIYLQTWTNGLIMVGLAFGEVMGAMVGGFAVLDGLARGQIKSTEDLTAAYTKASDEIKTTIFSGMFPGGVPDLVLGTEDTGKLKIDTSAYDKYTQTLQDTPTAPLPETSPTVEENKADLKGALEKFNKEIIEEQIKFGQEMEEIEIEYQRKLKDIDIEYAQKRADAWADYRAKVRDIESSYNDRLAEIASQQAQANQQARNDEIEREKKFQEQMRQLKEKFLMDMEDALHERDARQILRLIKQYNLQKTQAEREHALEKENAKRDQEERNSKFAAERADAARERAAKLAEAQQDYQDKLAKLAADEAAERAAAELKRQRDIEDLDRTMKDRLEMVAASLISEFNLTQEHLAKILDLYKFYYGEVSQVYAAMMAMLSGAGAIGEAMKPNNQVSNNGTTSGGGGTSSRRAEGGIMIANRPTSVLFGERGLEMATFTPINRTGMNTNRVFSNMKGSNGSGGGGTVQIEMLLSPDLEARVVSNTLSRAGSIITKVQRTKK